VLGVRGAGTAKSTDNRTTVGDMTKVRQPRPPTSVDGDLPKADTGVRYSNRGPDVTRRPDLFQRHVLVLQRTVGNHTLVDLLRGSFNARVQRLEDQHAGVWRPDPAAQAIINEQFFPANQVEDADLPAHRLPWDGTATSEGLVTPDAAANRENLRQEIWDAFDSEHLTPQTLDYLRQQAARYETERVPMATFEGAGRAAKRVVDAHFAGLSANAAFTPGQGATRHGFEFSADGAGRNLMDAYSLDDRALHGSPVSAESVLWWMVSRGSAATAQENHNLTPTQGSDEQQWLYDSVIQPYAESHRDVLELYDRFYFSITSGDKRVVIGSLPDADESNEAPHEGGSSPAVQKAQWGAWKTLVHEYIHVVEHPVFTTARLGTAASSTLAEGFCEYFTEEVLNPALKTIDSDERLRAEVEGQPAPPAPSPTILPREYYYTELYLQDVERVLKILETVTENGLRVAFFQGHVETLGLDPGGGQLAPVPAGTSGWITVPPGLNTVDDVANRFEVDASDIFEFHPDLFFDPTPVPDRLVIKGWSEHLVVEAADTGARTAETKEQIAAQHGIADPAVLDRANPGVDWANLHAGDIVLIPPHDSGADVDL
jgi:hypothetical protein